MTYRCDAIHNGAVLCSGVSSTAIDAATLALSLARALFPHLVKSMRFQTQENKPT